MEITSIWDRDLFELADQTLDAYPEPIALEDFGPYRLKEPIGRGGMGQVFLAEETSTRRRVALKFLRHVWLEPDLNERFADEIENLAQLEHPFIARLYGAGIHPSGAPYFVMEYVEGEPLHEYCRSPKCSLEERLRIFRSVCEAVQYAHSRLIVHRDLKPSNILVKGDGTPKLLDFGIAKQLEKLDQPATQTQTRLRFTPAYAAPEQFRGEPVGAYTDVYALGVILYELLTGKRPYDFENSTPVEVGAFIANHRDPEKPSVAANRNGASKTEWADLDVLCLTAMKKDVQKRYHSVLELIQDVDRYLNGEPLKARPDTLGYRFRKFLGRNRQVVLIASSAFLLVLTLAIVFTVRLAKARDAALAETARTQRVEDFMLHLLEGGEEEVGPSSDTRLGTLIAQGVKDAKALNTDPAIQADLYQTLGDIYGNWGDFDQADRLLQSSFEIRSRLFKPDSRQVAESLLYLGMARNARDQIPEAERLFRKALEMARRHAPYNDPLVTESMTGLGLVLERRGQFEQAIQVLDQASRIESTREDKKNLGDTLTALANVHYYLGDYAASESLNLQILALDRKSHGEHHPSLATDLINLGSIQYELGRYSEAERCYRQAFDIDQAWYGKEHPESADMLSYVGRALVAEARYDDAEPLLNEALAALQHAYGNTPQHPVAMALGQLGIIALERGELDKAEADFGRELEIERAVYGDKHRFTALALCNLGDVYAGRSAYPRAERTFRDAIQRLQRALPRDHPYIGAARVRLGRTLLSEHRYQEAEAETRPAYDILVKKTGPSTNWVRKAREDLVAEYRALNRPGDAAKFQ